MKEPDPRLVIEECAAAGRFCRATFKYEYTIHSILPLSVGEDCFLSADASGFDLDGFVIHRFSELATANPNTGAVAAAAAEGSGLRKDALPPINVTDMGSAADSLFRLRINVIAERRETDTRAVQIITGRIINCGPMGCVMLPFSTSLGWARTPVRISFREILSISFGQESLELVSRHLPPCPF